MHPGITAHSLQAGPSASSEVLADTPVVFYELNDAFGIGITLTTDSGPSAFFGQVLGHERREVDGRLTSGNPSAPILSGGPNGIPGLVNDGGGVYDFPGPDTGTTYNGAHLIEVGFNDIHLISHMSVEFWIDMDTFSPGSGALNARNHIVSSSTKVGANLSTHNCLWSVTVNATGNLGTYWEIGIRSPIITTSTHSISINTTHHIVVTRDGAAKTVTFWDNGVEFDTVGYSDNPTGGSETFMLVGFVAMDSFSRLNGKLDNIAIYNYSLPDARIIAHHNSGL